jgi:hypothetical protein
MVTHASQLLLVGGTGDGAQDGALQGQRADLGVEGARVRRGDIGQRRLRGQHAPDVVQAHPELAQRAQQPRPRDRLGPVQPVARFRARRLGQHADIGVETQCPHRQSGASGELADRHAFHLQASTRWRVKRLASLVVRLAQ